MNKAKAHEDKLEDSEHGRALRQETLDIQQLLRDTAREDDNPFWKSKVLAAIQKEKPQKKNPWLRPALWTFATAGAFLLIFTAIPKEDLNRGSDRIAVSLLETPSAQIMRSEEYTRGQTLLFHGRSSSLKYNALLIFDGIGDLVSSSVQAKPQEDDITITLKVNFGTYTALAVSSDRPIDLSAKTLREITREIDKNNALVVEWKEVRVR